MRGGFFPFFCSIWQLGAAMVPGTSTGAGRNRVCWAQCWETGGTRQCSRWVGMESQPKVFREAHESGCFVAQTAIWHRTWQGGLSDLTIANSRA